MLSLSKIYHPITASPFLNTPEHREVPPCEVLKPFIRCFWGTSSPAVKRLSDVEIVIPDTCMDVIFTVNHTDGSLSGLFCGIDDCTQGGEVGESLTNAVISTFGIRFYAWTAALFAEKSLCCSRNGRFAAEEYFPKLYKELETPILREKTLFERKAAAEKVLLKRLGGEIDNGLLNAVHYILGMRGNARISEVCGYAAVTEKTLERAFMRNMGISPKTFCSLVRYQLLWQEIVSHKGFDVLDAVEKYGYSDQSHLLNDFKRRHGMTPKEAVRFAEKCR